MSVESQKKLVASLMTVQGKLCPQIFSDTEDVLLQVTQKAEQVVSLLREKLLNPINTAEILDVVFCGNLCGYVYNDKTDFDLAVVLNDFAGNEEVSNHIIKMFNGSFSKRGFEFEFYGHPVDYFFVLSKDLVAIPAYSIMKKQWINKPVKRGFSFDVEFCYQQYRIFSKEVHLTIQNLPKVNDSFLTAESCEELANYLEYLRLSALEAKKNHPEHEYCLDYTMFRCLKHFGTYGHFRNFIRDSRNFHINGENGNAD